MREATVIPRDRFVGRLPWMQSLRVVGPTLDDGQAIPFSGEPEATAHGLGTMSVNGGTYAWTSVIAPTTAARTMLCQITALKMSASLPSWCVAAVATQILWASIILPMTPPVLLAVQMSTWACVSVRWAKTPVLWMAVAVIFCRLPNRALLPASVPVRKTPSQPRMAAKNG